jgi:signal transduction histidine kinase
MYDVALLSVVLSVVVGSTAAAWLLADHDPDSAAFALGAVLLVFTFWTATHVGTLFAENLRWLLLFKQLSYLGVVTAPVSWFAFAVRYTDHGEWLSRRRLALLSAVPVLTLLMVFTAQHHSLFYTTISVETVGDQPLLQTTAGPWHIVNVAYSYSLLLAGTGLLAVTALSDNRLYRHQSVILIACISVPWLVNMSYHLGSMPFPWFDATPMAFIAAGIPLGVIVVRTDLASFLPVAHERVFRSLDDPLLVVSPSDEIIDANDAAQRVLDGPTPLEGTAITAVLPAQLRDGQRLRTEFDSPVEVSLDHDGQTRQYLARCQPVEPDRESVSRGAVVTMTDITARKRRERELERLSERTQRKNEQLERMAGVISHDMAAPLSTAEKTLSLLRADLDDPDPSVEQSLDDLDTVHDRLRGFAEHLPRLARESIDVKTTEACDLATVTEAAWNTVETGHLELTITDSRTVHADRQRLQQVFENLLRNTVEHGVIATQTASDGIVKHGSSSDFARAGQTGQTASTDATGATTVRVGTWENGVFVEDDGPGISPDQREHIFEYGMSTGNSSGFGLAIVRTIIEAHGWEIDVADQTTEGARFEITIDDSHGP